MAAVAPGQQKDVTCSVRVVDGKARPVAGAEVVAYENFYDYADGRIRMELLGREETDEGGAVSFSLAIEKKRDVCIVAGKQGLAMGWDRFAPEVTIVLGEPFLLAGTVVDETGTPVTGAKVRVLLEGSHVRRIANRQPGLPQEWFRTVADAEGGFVFEGISGDAGADFFVKAPGKASNYTFMASDSMPGMRFAAGRTDIRIVLQPEAKIEGRVVDEAGKGAAGVRLLARPDKGVGNYYCTDSIVSEAGGRFCFTGLPEGTYSVQVVSPWGRTAEWIGEDVEVVANAGETVDGVTVKVETGVVLDVVVRDAATNRGIPDASVTLNKRARFGRHPCLYEYVKTDSDGRARLRALRGDCEIWAAGEGYSFSRQSCLIEEGTSPLELPLAREPS
ncbi:MAG: carboxypeptidase regulatory-like domain-containing protein, partial [Planctomycetota bacterium]